MESLDKLICSLMDFSQKDKDLLESLANLYNAVDIVALAKACEAFRESALRQRDRLAIGADALRLLAQTRGKSLDLESSEWQEFFRLADDIEDQGKRKRKGDNARQKRFRQLRIHARLTVLWGPKAMEHYGFINWNFDKLDSLRKCADEVPELVHFTNLANYFLLERHEKSLTSNVVDRIGQHSFRNQHNHVASKAHQPLQNRDLDRILKFLRGQATLVLNGQRCDTWEHLVRHSDRVDEWVQDDIGDLDVLGTKLRYYQRYQPRNYRLGYDVHGLLVPREYEDQTFRRKKKQRQQQQHEGVEQQGAYGEDDEAMEIIEDRSPVRKRAKTRPPSTYPSPPVSSPQESILSSPASSMDLDVDSVLDEDLSSSNSRFAGESSSNVGRNRWSMSSHGDTRSQLQFGTPLPTSSRPLSMQQDSSIRGSSPSCDRPESVADALTQSTPFSPAGQIEFSPQLASFDEDTPGTSCFDGPSPNSPELPAAQRASIIPEKNAFPDQLNFTQAPDTATSARSFSSLITFPPDTPSTPQCACPDSRPHVLTECRQQPNKTLCKAGLQPDTSGESPSCPSRLDCPICKGACSLCEVPSDMDIPTRHKLFEFGHRAQELERKAPNETLRRWIKPLKFARCTQDTTEGDGDVCLLSWESCKSQFEKGRRFEKPTIIREDFADTGEWTPSRYANVLELVMEGTDVDVKWHQKPQPERMPVSELVALLRSEPSTSLSEDPPNVLNLPDITDAILPGFLRIDRFRLLNLVIERCKADFQKHLGKQVHLHPFDIGSCGKFNILGWPGAFSGPHVDSNGATWARNQFGYKLWMYVPNSAMTPDDWKRFAEDGDTWDPKGKVRAVVLEPGDVWVMDARLIHSVQTLGDTDPCLMTGGMFWDQHDLSRYLESHFWIGKNQNATNEPIAYQLAQVISTVEDLVERNPARWFANGDILSNFRRVIKLLRSLGCNCEECDDECRCSQEDRRCTPLCAAHHMDESMPFSCMLEMHNLGNDSDVGDEDYIERS